MYQSAANAYVCSIMSLLHWRESRFLNARDEGAQISELTPFYEAAKVMYPLWYQNYSFERWIGFRESFNLLIPRRESRFLSLSLAESF